MIRTDSALLAARFPGRRAFITGAGSGLGLALARRLASAGWQLGLLDADAQRLSTVRAALDTAVGHTHVYHGDVRSDTDLTGAIDSFAAATGGLELMVNNAGVACAGALHETPADDWRWIIDINLMGVVHGCRAASTHLARSRCSLLINIASAAAIFCPPRMSAYNATKAAVVALSETLAAELRPAGVQVSVAMPAFFRTALLETMRAPPQEREIARLLMDSSRYTADMAATDLLAEAARGRSYIVLPKSLRKVWRYKRWFPERFLRRFPQLRARRPASVQQSTGQR